MPRVLIQDDQRQRHPRPADGHESYGDYSIDDEDQLQPEDTLADPDVDDALDRGYSPPEKYSAAQGFGNTPAEEAQGETLEMRIAQEEPEPDPYEAAAERADAMAEDEDDDHEVGDERAGRLVAPDEGAHEDTEAAWSAPTSGSTAPRRAPRRPPSTSFPTRR